MLITQTQRAERPGKSTAQTQLSAAFSEHTRYALGENQARTELHLLHIIMNTK